MKRNMTYASSGMINEEEFQKMVVDLATYDEKREQVIKRSRDIQKNAKQAIFSLHRGGTEQAAKQLATCEEVSELLRPVLSEFPDLKYGSFSNSMEEYAEARVFKMFIEERRLLAPSEIDVTREEYLGGVLDFCGELNRFCIAKATVRDVTEVKRCRDLVEGLMAVFLQFDFRNGALRKKFDSLKYTLKKMENTLYELALTEGGLGKSKAVDNDDGAAVMDSGEGEA